MEESRMTSSNSDPSWKKQVLVSTRTNLEADYARLKLRIETKKQNGLDVAKEQAELSECETKLAAVEADLKKLAG
jgi:hypothetical protein